MQCTKHLQRGDASNSTAWYSGRADFPFKDHPFVIRGGSYYEGTYIGGAFCFSLHHGGDASETISFRPVLIVPQ